MTRRTVLRPTWVLDADGAIARDRAIVVRDDVIESVVDLTDPSTPEIDNSDVVDLPGTVLVPGLINLHTHVGAGPIARGISEDYDIPAGMPFYVPLSRLWRHAYSPQVRQAYRSVVEWDLIGMLRTGTTTVVNHASVDVDGYLESALQLGVRTFAGPAVPLDVTHRLGTLSKDGARRSDEVGARDQHDELDGVRALHNRWHGRDGRIDILLGPAAAHAVDYSVLEAVGALSAELGCMVTTHLCQAPSELQETQRKYGLTPLRVLDRAGMVHNRLLAAHGTYLPDADIDLAASSGMTLVHCASRKAKEAVISPSVSFSDAGISVGLGTDGFSCDMVEELKFAAVLGKIGTQSTARATARSVIETATAKAAGALGRSDLGVIRAGATADLVAIDLSNPVTGPSFDPLQSLVYYGNGRDVSLTMVGGRIIFRGSEFVDVDMAAAKSRAQRAMDGIWDDALRLGLLSEVLSDATTGSPR